ncbi:50S ribosomal protein L32 [Patescibacteria group bacterium]|nr:50S ribosomal protein L32 [Patescibacteria group bacterium]
MAVPKRRTSTARKGKRRSGIGLSKPTLIKCVSCGEMKKIHRTCPQCGQY